ncbi:MAG TPA: DUF3090 family protein [Candidatus Dormibacteraeota bacterium]|nr:DUF3090 family protein [Candidatus Dormibacteraeota bacterium]
MPDEIELDPTDHIAVGTIGEPGQRAFYLQARSAYRELTMLVEKVQVQALAERAIAILEDEQVGPEETPEDLVEPVKADWRAGQLGLGFDPDRKLALMVAQEAPDPEDEEVDPESLSTARLWLRPAQLAALGRRGLELVNAGRPLCALCGLPLDPAGHLCPRKNGKSPVF